ncbi:MAG TPA: response regulator [Thermoanaerobaculia bacterium]|jgi:two-component system response regulator|nr:response regulator [Thermoanaerobaculia bacterium]
MSGKAILLVEDNPDDELLTRRALEKNNIANEVVVARDGVEALDYLLGPRARPLPALVLLDIKLPKLSGLQVLERLRAEPATRRLPVVMLTSSKEDRDLLAAYDGGVNSFVRKPVDFTEFVEAVRQLGMYWLMLNEQPPA